MICFKCGKTLPDDRMGMCIGCETADMERKAEIKQKLAEKTKKDSSWRAVLLSKPDAIFSANNPFVRTCEIGLLLSFLLGIIASIFWRDIPIGAAICETGLLIFYIITVGIYARCLFLLWEELNAWGGIAGMIIIYLALRSTINAIIFEQGFFAFLQFSPEFSVQLALLIVKILPGSLLGILLFYGLLIYASPRHFVYLGISKVFIALFLFFLCVLYPDEVNSISSDFQRSIHKQQQKTAH